MGEIRVLVGCVVRPILADLVRLPNCDGATPMTPPLRLPAIRALRVREERMFEPPEYVKMVTIKKDQLDALLTLCDELAGVLRETRDHICNDGLPCWCDQHGRHDLLPHGEICLTARRLLARYDAATVMTPQEAEKRVQSSGLLFTFHDPE